MSGTVFTLDKYFRTQPPQQIASVKVGNVLEYLAFFGMNLYFSITCSFGQLILIEEPAIVIDVLEDVFLM
jgi:hypothetical protein